MLFYAPAIGRYNLVGSLCSCWAPVLVELKWFGGCLCSTHGFDMRRYLEVVRHLESRYVLLVPCGQLLKCCGGVCKSCALVILCRVMQLVELWLDTYGLHVLFTLHAGLYIVGWT